MSLSLRSYCSWEYLVLFLPVAAVIYGLLPKKVKPYALLISSYAFFWLFSGKLIIYLLLSTVCIHYIGIWLSSVNQDKKLALSSAEKSEKKAIKLRFKRKQTAILSVAVLFHIGTLAVIKYTPFFTENVNGLLALFNADFAFNVPKFAAPVGISFYTLQAVSYLADVYNGRIEADKNIGRLALFMSFFPIIMEGPICRYSQVAQKLWESEQICFKNLTFGIQRILFGVMKKVVIADRVNAFVQTVFVNYDSYDGFITALAVVLYTTELYMEFSGTMDIVIGSGELFGVTVPENFRQPFFSRSISEFWTRWHISLGAWFKDYIFYPVSMSKPMKKLTSSSRKKLGNYYGPLVAGSIALLCVWLSNGLWHGAGWQYIFFGLYHFVLILSGNLIIPVSKALCEKLHIDRQGKVFTSFSVLRTTLLVLIGEMFFRATGLSAGFAMFKNMFCKFTFASLSDGTILNLGMDKADFLIVGIAVLFVFFISVVKERGHSPREWIAKRNIAVRWLIFYAFILFIVIFGAYGAGYIPVNPIYAEF